MLILTRDWMRRYIVCVAFGLVCMTISINVEGAGTWSNNTDPFPVTGTAGEVAQQLPTFTPGGGKPKIWVRYTATGLPDGLRLGWYSGYLSGRLPAVADTITFTYQAKVWQADARGEIATRQITITTTVSSPPVGTSVNLEADPSNGGTDDPVNLEADPSNGGTDDPVNLEADPSIIEIAPVPSNAGQGTLVQVTPGTPVPPAVASRRRTVVYCPVGWQHQTAFGTPTPQVLIRAIEVEANLNDPTGIYTPVAVEIYADPDEGRKDDLDGWKLVIAIPYNSGKDYLLTADNSEFDASGFTRIETADVPGGLLMTDVGFSGQQLPGFDYRLYDAQNQRVDVAISCYVLAATDLAARLREMENPRLERMLVLESLTWDTYYRSDWELPQREVAPGAPQAVPLKLAGTWASLKRRKE